MSASANGSGNPSGRPGWRSSLAGARTIAVVLLIVVGFGALLVTGRLAAVFPAVRVLLHPYAILLLVVIFVLVRLGRPRRPPPQP